MFLFSILVKTPFLIKRPARFAVLILVIALPAFSSIEQNPAPASAAPETPPYSWPRTHSYDVQHYRIALSFDWTKQSVRGETTITLQPFASDVKEIEIDAGDMTIESSWADLSRPPIAPTSAGAQCSTARGRAPDRWPGQARP